MLRGLRTAFATALAFGLACGPVAAEADRIVVDFAWNGEAQARTLIVLDGTQVWLARKELRPHGLDARDDACRTVLGECFVALDAFGKQLRYRFDPQELRLEISTATSLLPSRSVRIASAPPAVDASFLPSVLMNYRIDAAPGTPLTAAFEQRISPLPNVELENALGRALSGRIVRGLSSLTIDAPASMRRVVLGDVALSANAFGANAVIGGAVVQREFSLDPYAVTFPLASIETTVLRPSRADVYVNDVLVKSVPLAPGNYHLGDIPVTAGYSRARVVVRDDLGQQTSSLLQYGTTSLLRPGLSEYQYGAGFLRTSNGDDNARYGMPLASGRYRIGTSARTTLGGFAQAGAGGYAAGFEYGGLLGFGLLQADLAASGGGVAAGRALRVSYGTAGTRGALSVQARVQDPRFRTPAESADRERIVADAGISATQRLGTTMLAASAKVSRYAFSGVVRSTALTLMHRFGPWDASVSFTRQGAFQSGRPASEVALTLTRSRGTLTSQAVRLESGAHASAAVSVARGTSALDGSTYAVDAGLTADSVQSARAHVALPFGSLNLTSMIVPGGGAPASAALEGSVVYAARHLLFGRPVNDGFAVVAADGMAGAPVTFDGQYAGRTDRHGYLLLPGLASNAVNTVGVSAAGLALDALVDADGEARIGPRYHAGSLVRFGAHRVHAIFGEARLRDEPGGARVPAYGEMRLRRTGTSTPLAASPLDDAGRFYFDGIEAGTYDATILYGGRTCALRIVVAPFAEPAHDVGMLTCGA
jgi:outer membrane usher protein